MNLNSLTSSLCLLTLLWGKRSTFRGRDRFTKMTEVILAVGEQFSNKKKKKKKKWIVACFDPTTERSTQLANLAFREGAAIVSAGQGVVMISGGQVNREVVSSVELFSISARQSHPVSSLNVARRIHGACLVGDSVIVCGGHDGCSNTFKSCEVFFQNRWHLLPDMNEAHRGLAVVSSPDRRVFVIGGFLNSVAEFCRLPSDMTLPTLAEGFWEPLPKVRQMRAGPAAILVQDMLLVAGGWRRGNLPSVEMLPINQEGAQWVTLHALMYDRRSFFSLLVSSQGIYAIGGNEEHPRNSVERLELPSLKKKVLTGASISEQVTAAQWEFQFEIKLMQNVCGAFLSEKNQFDL